VADVAGQTKTAHFFDKLPHDKRRPRALITGDKAFKAFTASVASIVVLIIGLMAYYLYLGSQPSIDRFGAGFIVRD
jgi:ABC-type phosphate transport system permease subunit